MPAGEIKSLETARALDQAAHAIGAVEHDQHMVAAVGDFCVRGFCLALAGCAHADTGRARDACQSLLLPREIPMRRDVSMVTTGAPGAFRIRRPVLGLILLRAHHSRKLRTC